MTSLGIKPVTFWLVAQALNCVPPVPYGRELKLEKFVGLY
jgi:hypothetical protein